MNISDLLADEFSATPTSPVSSYSHATSGGVQSACRHGHRPLKEDASVKEREGANPTTPSSFSTRFPALPEPYRQNMDMRQADPERLVPHLSLGPPLVPLAGTHNSGWGQPSAQGISSVAGHINTSFSYEDAVPLTRSSSMEHQIRHESDSAGHVSYKSRYWPALETAWIRSKQPSDIEKAPLAAAVHVSPHLPFARHSQDGSPDVASCFFAQDKKCSADIVQPQVNGTSFPRGSIDSPINRALFVDEVTSGFRAERSQSKPFHCTREGCNAVFGQKGSLTRHLKNRHSSNCKPHACDLCPKTFSEKWTLNVHRRNVHLKLKAHQCPHCSKSFGEKWNLRKHINVVHLLVKPFSCPTCRRAFGYKGDMVKHVAELHSSSTAQRPFVCEAEGCGVKFARMRYLRRHQNLNHKSEVGTVQRPAYISGAEQKSCPSTPASMRFREEHQSPANSPITPVLPSACTPTLLPPQSSSSRRRPSTEDAAGMSNLKLFANVASCSLRPLDMQ